MKTIALTKGKVALVDDEDFEALNQLSWQASRSPYSSSWYAARYVYMGGGRKNRRCRTEIMHRVIMNALPGTFVDHINHDGLDNRRCNLRLCTKRENRLNSRKTKKGCSKYKGVGWCPRRKRWTARIKWLGTQKMLGRFEEEEDAAIVYNVAAQLLFGEFAFLNDV
jgi:hypothetical protein